MISCFRRATAVLAVTALGGLVLSGCATLDGLSQIGQEPALRDIENPVQELGYEPIILPMPKEEVVASSANSLWQNGARAFFKDQRASRVGDILTVEIEISDSAKLANTTERKRDSTEDLAATSLFGYEQAFDVFLPEAVDPTDLVDLSADSDHKGVGTIDRSETVSLKVAALITQVLPNGNLVIQGRQEVRINFEVRELLVHGVVRPEDIASDNTIDYEKIAEARIAYGGRGQLSDVQQPRYGTQLLDVIYPF